MWFNSTITDEPYQLLTLQFKSFQRWIGAFGNANTGAAWLSSARVVRCWVKSRNERNPFPILPAGYAGNYLETAGDKSEEGGDDVKSSCPLWAGLHTCYNGVYNGLQHGDVKLILRKDASVQIAVCNSTA